MLPVSPSVKIPTRSNKIWKRNEKRKKNEIPPLLNRPELNHEPVKINLKANLLLNLTDCSNSDGQEKTVAHNY